MAGSQRVMFVEGSRKNLGQNLVEKQSRLRNGGAEVRVGLGRRCQTPNRPASSGKGTQAGLLNNKHGPNREPEVHMDN
jgi:hypothetical protein